MNSPSNISGGGDPVLVREVLFPDSVTRHWNATLLFQSGMACLLAIGISSCDSEPKAGSPARMVAIWPWRGQIAIDYQLDVGALSFVSLCCSMSKLVDRPVDVSGTVLFLRVGWGEREAEFEAGGRSAC